MQLTATGFGQKTGTGDAFDLRLVLHGKASNTKTKATTTGWAKNNAWHNVKFRKKTQREREGEGGRETS